MGEYKAAVTASEQMMRRQSAPQPSAKDYVSRQQEKALSAAEENRLSGSAAIGREQIHDATQVLMRYKAGKANLEQKIVENEQWYKMRHWECLRSKDSRIQPTSGWLFNAIANKHADAMDNFPSPNFLPREEGDKAEAEMLSSVVPVILDQCDFEQVYSDVWTYKLKTGTGVYAVFWDKTKHNGLGDIAIKKIDLLNLFWEPGITDIQKSRNLFTVELVDNEILLQSYPQLDGNLGTAGIDIARYVYDDTVDTTEKSVVVDWYYHKYVGGRKVLHYCKFVNDSVLFATENDSAFSEKGWYAHGEYPFVFDVLFPIEGTPAGIGYIDEGKSAQEFIDRGNQAILENMLANAKPRYFIREDGGVNEEEFADLSRDLVHIQGTIDNNVAAIQTRPLSNIFVGIINNKIDELKETLGNRDISNGGTSSGVTAASAIAALQEAGSKLSRDHIKASYRAFRKICALCVELIRQFYDIPRCFRIIGKNGAARFIRYSNENIQPQQQGTEFGIDLGYRLPLFDIEITAQKQSPYAKVSQNELALQFYSAGFFNPSLSQQALACLEMMDFDRKSFVMQQIAQNGEIYRQMMLSQAVQPPKVRSIEKGEESTTTKKARQRVAESTAPN